MTPILSALAQLTPGEVLLASLAVVHIVVHAGFALLDLRRRY